MKGPEHKITPLRKARVVSSLVSCVCFIFCLLVPLVLHAAQFTNIGHVRFEAEGEVGSSQRVLRFFLPASVRGTNEDDCYVSGGRGVCVDYVRAYITDNENKILGRAVIDIHKGNVRSGEIGVPLVNKSFTFSYKFILTDISEPEGGKEIGDVFESENVDDKSGAARDVVRTFDPTKLDGNKPEDWVEESIIPDGNSSDSNRQLTSGPIVINVGDLHFIERAPAVPINIDVGQLRIIEPLQVIEVGTLSIVERGAEPPRQVDVGKLILSERGVEPDRTLNIGSMKIIERGVEPDRAINIGNLRINELGFALSQELNIGSLKVIERGIEPDRTLVVGGLRIIERGVEPDRAVNIGELSIVERGTEPDRNVEVGNLQIIENGENGETAPGQPTDRIRIAHQAVDIGEFRVVGRRNIEHQAVDIGEFWVVGRRNIEHQAVDIGELRVMAAREEGDHVIDAGELKVIGVEHKLKINAGTLRVIGARPPVPNFIRPGNLPGRVKVSVIRVRKLSGETNPFDPVEVAEDIVAAQNGTLGGSAGGAAIALTVAGVPFTDFNQIFVNLDAAGTALSVDNLGAMQVLDIQSTGGILNIAISPGFTQISTNGGLVGLGGTVSRQIVVRRNSDGVHFQLNVNITSTFVDVTLNALTGSNCGALAGNCP